MYHEIHFCRKCLIIFKILGKLLDIAILKSTKMENMLVVSLTSDVFLYLTDYRQITFF